MTFLNSSQQVHYQYTWHERRTGRGRPVQEVPPPCGKAVTTPGFGAPRQTERMATTENHEPFQQCCNTVSFWFKNTHTLTNAKCTLLGKVLMLQILEAALTLQLGSK